MGFPVETAVQPWYQQPSNWRYFSRKSNNYVYSSFTFINDKISKSAHQNNLGVVLDSKLEFSTHIKQKIKNSTK